MSSPWRTEPRDVNVVGLVIERSRLQQGTDVIGRDFNSRTSVHEVRLLMSSGLDRISHKIVDSMVELLLSCITVLRTSPIRKMLDSIE